ncbi:MAG: hypothetical protein R3C28_22895 [Pirellulaceae bacterium]
MIVVLHIASVGIALLGRSCLAETGAAADGRLRILRELYLENRERFPFYRCVIEVRKLESIESSKYDESIFAKEGTLLSKIRIARDAHRIAYESLDGIRPSALHAEWPAITKVLSSDQGTLAFDGVMAGAVLYASNDRAERRHEVTPWNLGGMFIPGDDGELANIISSFLMDDTYSREVNADVPFNEVQTFQLSFRSRGFEVDIWVDPARGCLPIGLAHGAPDQPKRQYRILEIANQNGAWFPMVTLVTEADWSHEYKITKLDLTSSPSDADFAVSIPAGTVVEVDGSPNSQFSISSERQVRFDQLSTLAAHGKQVETKPVSETEQLATSCDNYSDDYVSCCGSYLQTG